MIQGFKNTASWVLYGLGNCAYFLMGISPYMYPTYNYLMWRSSDLQGESPRGPWKNINEEKK